MAMTLKPRLRVKLALECPVCHEDRDPDAPRDTIVSAALYGTSKYGVCPRCSRAVDDTRQKDRNYRARFRRFIKRMHADRAS